jgi:nucleoside-diphosphate-sugar epimerase
LSTLKVYGNVPCGNIITDENSECNPTDPYGKSKLEAEIGLKELEGPDFIVSVIRTPLVYGEGVKANMLSLIKLVEKIRILPFKNTGNRRNYTYVGNLVGFIDRIIEKKASGVFIVKDNEALSTTDLVTLLAKNLDRKLKLFSLPPVLLFIFKNLFKHYYERLYGSMEVNNTKTKIILDYQPPYSIDEGISRMISAYKKNKC